MNDIPSNLKTQSLLKNQASNQSGVTNPYQKNSFTSTHNNLHNPFYPSLPNTNKSNVNIDKQNINDFNEGSFPAITQKIQSNQAGMQNYNNAASAISFKPSNEGNTVMNPYENINSNNNHNNFDGVVVGNDFHSNQLNSNLVNPVRTQVNIPVSNGNSASDANKFNNNNNNTLNFCSNPNINSVNNCNQNYTQSQNNQMNNYNNQYPQPNIYLLNNKNLNHLNNKNNNNNNNYSNNPGQYQQLNSTLNTNESYSLPRQQPMSMELPVILNTANPQTTPDFPVRGNQLTANPIEAEDRDGKHLCWIIALTVLFGFLAGFYFCLNFSRIRRKELAVGVYLGVCFITTIAHVLYFVALGKSSDLF